MGGGGVTRDIGFADVMARRKAVFTDSHLSSACAKGSKGDKHMASNTRGRSDIGDATSELLLGKGTSACDSPLYGCQLWHVPLR